MLNGVRTKNLSIRIPLQCMVRVAFHHTRQLNRVCVTIHIRNERTNAHECLYKKLRCKAHKLHRLWIWLETNKLLLRIQQAQQLFLYCLRRYTHPIGVSSHQRDSTAHHRWIWIQQYIQRFAVDERRNSCFPERYSDVFRSTSNEVLQHVHFYLFLNDICYHFRMIISFSFL